MTHPWAHMQSCSHRSVSILQAYTANGLMGLLRPPHLHVAPPLVISEEELLDGFDRQDKALYTLDEALGF